MNATRRGPPTNAPPGEQISFWRGTHGWSQSELAKRANLDANSGAEISRMESGAKNSQLDTVQRVAAALGETIYVYPERRIPIPVGKKAPEGASVREQITYWRGVRGMTQAELATAMGLDTGGNAKVSRIESGASQPRLEVLARIATALGVTLCLYPVAPPEEVTGRGT